MKKRFKVTHASLNRKVWTREGDLAKISSIPTVVNFQWRVNVFFEFLEHLARVSFGQSGPFIGGSWGERRAFGVVVYFCFSYFWGWVNFVYVFLTIFVISWICIHFLVFNLNSILRVFKRVEIFENQLFWGSKKFRCPKWFFLGRKTIKFADFEQVYCFTMRLRMLLSHLKDLEVQIAFFEILCKTLTKSHEIDKQRRSRDFLAVKL